jgi:hypothetical protein
MKKKMKKDVVKFKKDKKLKIVERKVAILKTKEASQKKTKTIRWSSKNKSSLMQKKKLEILYHSILLIGILKNI